MYDIVLKNGTVIDPSISRKKEMDLAISNGKIAALEESIDSSEAERALDVSGQFVTPGLIDLHTHVYYGGTHWGIDPRDPTVNPGVTTFVDAGSAGAGNFQGFKEFIIDGTERRVKSFLHIAFSGLASGIYLPDQSIIVGELSDIRYAALGPAVETGKMFPEDVLGIKIRASVTAASNNGLQAIELAKRAAGELDIPLMVHVSSPPPLIDEVLPRLRSGDILTHAFRGSPNSLLRNGEIIPEFIDAVERGVRIDIGHGGNSFSFDVTRQLLDEGYRPDVISSDVHVFSIEGPAHDLLTTMSKFLNLGHPLMEVIEATTTAPSRVLGLDSDAGSLEEGRWADVTVLEIEKGEFQFLDSMGVEMTGTRRLSSPYCIVNGELIEH